MRGFGRGKRYFVGARRHRHTPDLLPRELTIPLPTLIHDAVELLKAAFNVFTAEGRMLDDPRDLTEDTTAQTAFSYTSRSGRAGFLYQTGGVNS
jgi:hypothetical protein